MRSFEQSFHPCTHTSGVECELCSVVSLRCCMRPWGILQIGTSHSRMSSCYLSINEDGRQAAWSCLSSLALAGLGYLSFLFISKFVAKTQNLSVLEKRVESFLIYLVKIQNPPAPNIRLKSPWFSPSGTLKVITMTQCYCIQWVLWYCLQ